MNDRRLKCIFEEYPSLELFTSAYISIITIRFNINIKKTVSKYSLNIDTNTNKYELDFIIDEGCDIFECVQMC